MVAADPPQVELGTIEERFPWGYLVVEAEGGMEPIHNWDRHEAQVTAGATAVVVKVVHEQEGAVVVHLSAGSPDLPSKPVFAGEIDVPSGVLCVGDALRRTRVTTTVGPGRLGVRVFLDARTEAEHVDVVIDAGP